MMKKFLSAFLCLSLLFSLTACTPAAEVTPEPTPEPTPGPTPFPSYEDYFSQRIYYGTTTDDQDLHDVHISYDPEEIARGVALAQALVPDDPWGLIPQTLEWVADGCLYFFWAGGQEGLSLYRLYAPSKTLDCLYAIPEEELDNYFYTPQTETVADWISYTGQSGEQKCLLINGFESYSNYEILWWSYNREFLELFDRVMAHPGEYPDCFEGEDGPRFDIYDIVFYLERNVGMCSNEIAHYLNADSGRYDTRPCGIYMNPGYWWENGPTPFPSYEDYFAQKIEYIDPNSDEPYFSPVGWNVYASTPEAAPGLALAQELVTGDTLGWISLTLSRSPDGNLYAFWAGTGEGAFLYRLYYPTKTLDLICTISTEELEQYYYTIQTEATAALLFPARSPEEVIGERVCLMGYTEIVSNQEILWGSYDPAFLALFDDMAAHKEDHPQYAWDKLGYEDVADIYVETDSGLTLDLCHYCNSVTGEYRVHCDAAYGLHDYWWEKG